jgi:hypothetical protein
MGKIANKRLSAATLVEAMVAMVIILVIFGITTTVLVQTSLRSFSVKRIKAAQLVNTLFAKTISERSFFNEEVTLDGWIIRKDVQQYNGNNRVLEIKIIVLDDDSNELENEQRLIRQK